MSDEAPSLDVYKVPVTEFLEVRVWYYAEGTTPEEAKKAASEGRYVERRTTNWQRLLQRKLGTRAPERVEF